jgi:hypothetical protein
LAVKARGRKRMQGRLNIYMDEETKRRLEIYAETVDLTDGGAGRVLIEEGLDRRGIRAPVEQPEKVPA